MAEGSAHTSEVNQVRTVWWIKNHYEDSTMKKCEMLRTNKEAIIGAYQGGASMGELSRKYECNGGQIWAFLVKECGVTPRVIQKVAPNREKILALYHEGKSAYWIDRHLGIGKGNSERAIKGAGFDISWAQRGREDPLKNHKERIIWLYENWYGATVIGKEFGTSDCSIRNQLRAWGVKLRTLRDYAYPVDEHYFDSITSHESAYIFGFLMADGSNDTKHGVVKLSITDEPILRIMADKIGWQGPIHLRRPRKESHKTQYLMAIGSRVMSDALVKVGCVKRKTYHAQFPTDEQVSPQFHNSLLRGWLDGDGTITHSEEKNDWHSRIVGTEAVCKGIGACIKRHLGFPGWPTIVYTGEKHTTWGVTVSSRDNLSQYLSWLYEGASLYLHRKYRKYVHFSRQNSYSPVRPPVLY